MSENQERTSWKEYSKDPVILWVGISFSGVIISYAWQYFDPEFFMLYEIRFLSWLSSLLAVGYLSTPSGSWQGKVAFAGVCFVVSGIAMKILHLPAANVLIIAGLAIIVLAYSLLWIKK